MKAKTTKVGNILDKMEKTKKKNRHSWRHPVSFLKELFPKRTSDGF